MEEMSLSRILAGGGSHVGRKAFQVKVWKSKQFCGMRRELLVIGLLRSM